MISVIIAGGSGTRLWPLSTHEYPKHLLKVNGNKNSLLQDTYERIKSFSTKVYVITEKSHAHLVKEQLPGLKDDKFIVEPARRGTASCIVAGLSRLSKTVDKNEPIAFVAADHYVRDAKGFEYSFNIAQDISRKEQRIVLVGVEPDHPATGFGYIEKGSVFDDQSLVYNVKEFKEKPSYKMAQKYLRSGNYLWNCSYFVASLNTFLTSMQKYAPELKDNYDKLTQSKTVESFNEVYLNFENIAIDYALIERVKNLLVVPASFDWMDLGSFMDLHKASENDVYGNHKKGNIELLDVQNSFIQNHQSYPVAVIGLDNVVVINTKNGLLVARKDMSQEVGDIAKKVQKNDK